MSLLARRIIFLSTVLDVAKLPCSLEIFLPVGVVAKGKVETPSTIFILASSTSYLGFSLDPTYLFLLFRICSTPLVLPFAPSALLSIVFIFSYELGASVFRTVQSVHLGGRTGRTASGIPSFFKSMDGLGQMEVGPDALPGPVVPCGIFLSHLFGWYAQKLQAHDWILLIVYNLICEEECIFKE